MSETLELINLADLMKLTGYAKITIYGMVQKNRIPGVIRLPGKNTKLNFNKAIIMEWLKDPRNYLKTFENVKP
jgi:predicted DNA-binding transcriptional regulator AlpA